MEANLPEPSAAATHVLLIEADSNMRGEHASTLQHAGYIVREVAGLPAEEDIDAAELILTDAVSFEWLRDHTVDSRVVVLTDDLKVGITACLCGATDWVPIHSPREYLLDVVREATARRRPL
jgi:hypothetical protein